MNIVDKKGTIYMLGKELGRGGEGAVFHLIDHPDHVAKIYHKKPTKALIDKLVVMCQNHTHALREMTAWPETILYVDGKVIGFVCKKVKSAIEIHQLYNPRERKEYFPKVHWDFLIHAAINLARAFETVHKHGHAIGDVNDRNILISSKALVNFIDCDSFQVQNFPCSVGMPMYLPPELQKKPLTKKRSKNHDNFALATFIFQLLFMGRHPFSGTYLNEPELTLSDAISKGYFCYTSKAVMLPKHALPFSLVPPYLQELFIAAFSQKTRPHASEWIRKLTKLQQELSTCKKNPTHTFFGACQWCHLEEEFHLSYFSHQMPNQKKQLDCLETKGLWKEIEAIIPLGPPPPLHFSHKKLKPKPFHVDATLVSISIIPLLFVAFLFCPSMWLLVLFGGCFYRKLRTHVEVLLRKKKMGHLQKAWEKKQKLWHATSAHQPFKETYFALLASKNELASTECKKRRNTLLDHLKKGPKALEKARAEQLYSRKKLEKELRAFSKEMHQAEVNLKHLLKVNH